MATTKFYAFADVKRIITWCKGAKLQALLAEHGINPAHEVRTATRTYRVYDAAAIKQIKALAKAHNAANDPADPAPAPAPAPATAALSYTDIRQIKQLMDEVTGLRNLLALQNNRMMDNFNSLASEVKQIHSDHAQIIDLLTKPGSVQLPSFDDVPSPAPTPQ